MKIYRLVIILLFLTFLASCASNKIDYSKELNINFQVAKENLLKNNFIQMPPRVSKEQLGIYAYTFTNYNYMDKEYPLNITLYAENENSNIKYMEIGAYTTNITLVLYYQQISSLFSSNISPRSRHVTSPEQFKYIQEQVSFLNCSTDKKFLTSSFKCANDYKVTGNVRDETGIVGGVVAISSNVVITIKPQ